MRVWLSFKFIIHIFFFFLVDIYINIFILFVNVRKNSLCNTTSTRNQRGKPRINIIGATNYGELKTLLPELSQIIFSPGPLIFKLRKLLKDFRPDDYLLLIGDPALIGVACSIVSDITNGKYNLLKWDKQERKYYPIKINLYEKGEVNE